MNYKIFKDDKHINTIYADLDFVISYCEENDYTYEQEEVVDYIEPTTDTPDDTDNTDNDVTWDALAAAYTEGVNEA